VRSERRGARGPVAGTLAATRGATVAVLT
jgi:hypothetical protein